MKNETTEKTEYPATLRTASERAEFRRALAAWRAAQGTPEAFSTVNPYDPSGE